MKLSDIENWQVLGDVEEYEDEEEQEDYEEGLQYD